MHTCEHACEIWVDCLTRDVKSKQSELKNNTILILQESYADSNIINTDIFNDCTPLWYLLENPPVVLYFITINQARFRELIGKVITPP